MSGDDRLEQSARVRRRGRFRLSGLGLPRSLAEVRFRDVAVPIIVGLTIFAYVDIAPHGRIENGRLDRHKTDFTVFTEAGAAFFDGRDPYKVTNPRGWYYLYPPLFALAVSPLRGFASEAQVGAWYVVSCVLAFGCFFEARRLLWRLAGECKSAPTWWFLAWVAACAFLATVLPALDCLQRGQLGIALLYLLMLGARLALTGRSWPSWFAGGIVLALAAVIKLVPTLPVGCLVVLLGSSAFGGRGHGRPRARSAVLVAGVLAGALAFLLLIPAAIIGWQQNLDSLERWTQRVVANEQVGKNSNFDIHSARNQSLANAAYLLHGTLRGDRLTRLIMKTNSIANAVRVEHAWVHTVIGLVLLSLLALVVIRGRAPSYLDHATGYALACWATLIASPLAWGHYYMVELPGLISVPLWLWHRGWTKSARVAAAVPPVLVWVHYVSLKHIGPLGVLGLGTTAWYFVVIALIAACDLSDAIGRWRRRSTTTTHLGRHHLREASFPSQERARVS